MRIVMRRRVIFIVPKRAIRPTTQLDDVKVIFGIHPPLVP